MSTLSRRALACDLWICDSLGGAEADDTVWLARLRGLALGGAGLTLAMSGWKTIGPLRTADLLLIAAALLLLPRFSVANVHRMWVPALAVGLITVGGLIGTATTSGADVTGSAEMLIRWVSASVGAMLLVVCWRPGLEQIKSFSLLWVAGGVVSGVVALLLWDPGGSGRPPGLTPHPTHLAIISLILVGVTLGLVSADRRPSHVLLGLAACGALFAAIVASGSRAGLAAAVLVVLLALTATRGRIAIAAVIGLAALGLGFAVLGVAGGTPAWKPGSSQDNALERLFQERVEQGRKREAVNAAGWERFKSHPVTGVGFAKVLKPHNFPLMLASSAGVLGIIGATMIIALALRSYALAVWKRMVEHPEHWAMAAGLSAAVIGYLAASLFQNVLWDRNVWIAIALMTWAAALARRRDPAPPASPPHPEGPASADMIREVQQPTAVTISRSASQAPLAELPRGDRSEHPR